jgi:hypothetical protein
MFERLGAVPWAERAAQAPRATDETIRKRESDGCRAAHSPGAADRPGGRRRRHQPQSGASLVLSPKTIEVHLSRVYRKRGIRSRTELARLFAGDEAAQEVIGRADRASAWIRTPELRRLRRAAQILPWRTLPALFSWFWSRTELQDKDDPSDPKQNQPSTAVPQTVVLTR